MNKYIYFAATVFIAVILGVFGFIYLRSSNNPEALSPTSDSSNSTMEDDRREPNEADEGASMNDLMSGSYKIYSEEDFEEASEQRRVLFFYANWCPTCRPADEEFRTNTEQIPSDVTVFRINYNDSDTEPFEEDLADKYGITYQHTFVEVDEMGEVVRRWNGGGLDKLISELQ